MFGPVGRTRVSRIAGVAAIVVIALTLPIPVFAAPEDNYSFGERVDLAGAAWITETDASLTDLTIRVFDRAERSTWTGPINYKDPGIILFYVRRVVNPLTGEVVETNYEGIYGGPGSSFEMSPSFAGAEAIFTLDLYGYRCVYPPGDAGGGPQGIDGSDPECWELSPVTVDGHIEWTGEGPVIRDVFKSGDRRPPLFMFGAHTVSAARNASVAGEIEGGGITFATGPATFGTLLRGKYHEHYVAPGSTG